MGNKESHATGTDVIEGCTLESYAIETVRESSSRNA